MYYVTAFDEDPTKSFTQTAFNNLKCLQTQKINFEIRPLSQVLNWGSKPSWFLDEDRDYFTNTTPPKQPSAIVHLQISDLLKVPYRSKEYAVGYTAFEASLIPRWICEGLNQSYRGLIVPSQHCKSVLERSGLTIPVRVVPHALPSMWLQNPKPPIKDPSVYVFGNVGYWNSRKNQTTLIDAYLKAFPEHESGTALLLKTFHAGDVESYIRKVAGCERKDIWVYDDSWSDAQMLWGFSYMDCYVSPHRGEGFGLTIAQAASFGKPCIYTDYSAPTEWLGEGHLPVKYNLVSVSDTISSDDFRFEHTKGEHIEWADVDIEDLVSKMKFAKASNLQSGFSQSDLDAFRTRLRWESVGVCLVDAVEDILGRPLERLQ